MLWWILHAKNDLIILQKFCEMGWPPPHFGKNSQKIAFFCTPPEIVWAEWVEWFIWHLTSEQKSWTWFMKKRKSAIAVARTSGATTSTITVKRIANLWKQILFLFIENIDIRHLTRSQRRGSSKRGQPWRGGVEGWGWPQQSETRQGLLPRAARGGRLDPA